MTGGQGPLPGTDQDQPGPAEPVLLTARIAGLPAAAMEVFRGGPLPTILLSLHGVEDALEAARNRLVAACFEAVGDSPAEHRRTLLDLKRKAFNGRPIQQVLESDAGPDLPLTVRRAAQPVAQLERELLDRGGELADALRVQLRAEAAALSNHLDRPAFLRALVLSSRPLTQQLGSIRQALAKGSGRKERRARYSLARYLSRATFKLSAFSTFTRWALVDGGQPTGEGIEGPCHGICLRGIPAEWNEVSLVRMRRYLVEQVEAAWRQSPTVRRKQPVALNPTLRVTGEDVCELLSPQRWIPRGVEAAAWFRSVGGMPVEASVDRAVIDWLRELVSEEVELGALEDRLASELGGDDREARSRQMISRFLRKGILVATTPWPRTEARLEETLADWFETASNLAQGEDSLASLVALEREFPEAENLPVASRKIDLALDAAWAAARSAAEIPEEVTLHRFKEAEIYEDVVITSQAGRPRIAADSEVLRDLLRQASPWHRLLDFFSIRHDILLTVAEVVRRRWPRRQRGSALEVFSDLFPHWSAARRIFQSPLSVARGERAFNPLDLAEIHQLSASRDELLAGLRKLLKDAASPDHRGEVRISSRQLSALLDNLPAGSAPLLGPCLFVQPEASGSDRWVVHRVFEGTGRYPGRMIPALPRSSREPLLSAMIHRPDPSVRGSSDDRAELVDLYSSRGDTLNVHGVRTRRALWLPGETPPVATAGSIPLAELEIVLGGTSPTLVDGQGKPILPVHLGAATLAFMPAMIAFLAQFGAGEIHSTIPPQPHREIAGVRHFDRVVLDRLVLARRRWQLPLDWLTPALEKGDSAAYSALGRWRREHGIPDRVFAIERVHFGDQSTFKPQFLDLRSPTFCELLVRISQEAGEPLVLEEMLPEPEGFPRDREGNHWATELIVDAWCFES